MLKVFHESVPSERNTNLRKKMTQKSYHMFLSKYLYLSLITGFDEVRK